MFTAWNTARLSTFHGGKLRSLDDELKKLRPAQPKRQQTNEEIIATMRLIRETMAGAAPETPPPA
jgi:hypothetical protein